MKSKEVRITGINDLTTFITKANLLDGDVLVYRGKFVVDGKSLMGLMSINIAEGCKVEYPETATDFENFLSQFEIKH